MLIDTILSLALLRATINLIASIKFSTQADVGETANQPPNDAKVRIVISVLNEDRSILDCAKFYANQIGNLKGWHLVFVGTELERKARNGASCLDIIENDDDLKSVQVYQSENKNPSKAEQLNAYLSDDSQNWDPAEILLFLDIDTRLPLRAVTEELPLGENTILQFHTLFLSNYRKLSYLQRGQALYQSRWTICHEFRRLWLSRFTRGYSSHLVAHGLAMHRGLLKQLGYFPTRSTTEDVHLGFIANQAKADFRSAKSLTLSDNPELFLDGMKQEASWSYGPMRYPLYLNDGLERELISRSPKSMATAVSSAFFGTCGFPNWALQGPVLILALLSIGVNPASSMLIVVYLLDIYIALAPARRAKLLNSSDFLKSIPAIIIVSIRRSIPALWAGLVLLYTGTARRYKTEHYL